MGAMVGLSSATILLRCQWLAVWYYRHRCNDPTASTDFVIAILADFWTLSGPAIPIHASLWICLFLFVPVIDWVMDSASGVLVAGPKLEKLQHKHSENISPPWTRPLLLPGRTTHTRMFPARHSFSYSYFMVGTPVGWTGGSGFWLSVDSGRRALLEVNASDYLMRGLEESGLRGKLDYYLISEKLDPNQYPFAFLVTAPRVLGYSFNPVSFWYLFSSDKVLMAMILEVNNTFDERRLYFLQRSSGVSVNGEVSFTTTWEKDFHVSPFNDRAGSYSLVAKSINFDALTSEAWMSNTITLLSSEKKTKLVARIFTTEQPIDAMDLSLPQAARLLLRYGWVGFVTFPRILKEAWKLYFRKSLQLWLRPEVAVGSIGRSPTAEEKVIERFFRKYLEMAVNDYGKPVRLVYRPSQGLGLRDEYILESAKVKGEQTEIALNILTPAFYSRVLHYTSMDEAIWSEGLCSELKNRTVDAISPDILVQVLTPEVQTSGGSTTPSGYEISSLDRLRWQLLKHLRGPPGALAYAGQMSSETTPSKKSKIHCSGFSPLDDFVMRACPDAWLYRRHAISQFIAQRVAFGLVEVTNAADLMIRLVLTVTCWSLVQKSGLLAESGRPNTLLAMLLVNVANLLSLLVKGL